MTSGKPAGALMASLLSGTALLYFFMKPTSLKTSGMQNVEDRFVSAGGSATHTPAQASPLGRSDLTRGAQQKEKGIGTKHWQDNHGVQKPDESEVGKKFNRAVYGQEKNKQ